MTTVDAQPRPSMASTASATPGACLARPSAVSSELAQSSAACPPPALCDAQVARVGARPEQGPAHARAGWGGQLVDQRQRAPVPAFSQQHAERPQPPLLFGEQQILQGGLLHPDLARALHQVAQGTAQPLGRLQHGARHAGLQGRVKVTQMAQGAPG